MVKLKLKESNSESDILGYKEINILFNLGPFPGGGDCVIVEADGEIMYLNSNDLIETLENYHIINE